MILLMTQHESIRQTSYIDIPANGVATAIVKVNVPADAAPGEQYAVVWVEARSTAEGGVAMISRVGVRVYLSVGPGGPPAADFVIESLTAERSPEGIPAVVATVRNTGGRALDLSGSLTMRNGPGGLKAGPFPAQLGTTLGIGETAPVTIELDPTLPAGPWEAELTLACIAVLVWVVVHRRRLGTIPMRHATEYLVSLEPKNSMGILSVHGRTHHVNELVINEQPTKCPRERK